LILAQVMIPGSRGWSPVFSRESASPSLSASPPTHALSCCLLLSQINKKIFKKRKIQGRIKTKFHKRVQKTEMKRTFPCSF